MSTIPPTLPPRSHLLRKIVLLLLLTSAVAFGVIFLIRAGQPMAHLTLISLGAAMLGLAAGFGARWVLRGRHDALRLLAAFASLVVGLVVLGLFTRWEYGLGPIVFWQNRIQWGGLFQLAVGGFSVLVSMFAWRGQPLDGSQVPEPPRTPRTHKPFEKRRLSQGTRPRASRQPAPSAAVNVGAQPQVRETINAEKKSGRSTRTRIRRKHRKPEVVFAATEEHRCPYCLEPVLPDDPRGVVECKICHTLHHADCWEITGVCQVPHLNS